MKIPNTTWVKAAARNSLQIHRKVFSRIERIHVYRSCTIHNYVYVLVVEVQIDEGTVAQLVDMGFHVEACKKAVFNTNNSGVEAAMNWVMEHMDDPGNQYPGHTRSEQLHALKYSRCI